MGQLEGVGSHDVGAKKPLSTSGDEADERQSRGLLSIVVREHNRGQRATGDDAPRGSQNLEHISLWGFLYMAGVRGRND